jgi:hypothetical protein
MMDAIGSPNLQAMWMDESPDHFLWRRKAEELQKDVAAYQDDCDRMARERNHYEQLVDRAAELLMRSRQMPKDWDWSGDRSRWFIDAGMEEKIKKLEKQTPTVTSDSSQK